MPLASKLMRLGEMFAHLDTAGLLKVLDAHGGDMMAAMETLLTTPTDQHDTCQREPGGEGLPAQVEGGSASDRAGGEGSEGDGAASDKSDNGDVGDAGVCGDVDGAGDGGALSSATEDQAVAAEPHAEHLSGRAHAHSPAHAHEQSDVDGSGSAEKGEVDYLHIRDTLVLCAGSEPEAQLIGVRTIAGISSTSSAARGAIISEGGLLPLLEIARKNTSDSRSEQALRVLSNLALETADGVQERIVTKYSFPTAKNGMINVLVVLATLLDADDSVSSPVVKEQSARMIANLSFRCEAVELAVDEADLLPSLLLMVLRKDTPCLTEALAALANLARNTTLQLRIMAAAEDLESLGKFQWQSVFHLLHSQHKDNSGQLEVQRQAVRFIGNLSIHERNKASLVAEGVVEPLFLALQLGEAEAVRLAALAVANLSTLEKNRTALGKMGAVPKALALMTEPPVETQLHASRVVFNMMSTMTEEEKIKTLHATRILGIVMNLTEHPDLRLQIIAGKILGHFPQMPGLSQTW